MEEYEEGLVVENQEILQAKILDANKQDYNKDQELDPLEKQKMQEKKDNRDRKYMREEKAKRLQQNFQREFRNLDELFEDGNVKVPPILYVANKSEDGFEGDILGDFYQKFPNAATDIALEPIFISAEHGDGFNDLYAALKSHIPDEKLSQYVNRREKRLSRFVGFKDQLMDEIVQFKMEEMEKLKAEFGEDAELESDGDLELFLRQWEKDFDRANPDPGHNSDFDSDNDINPIDSLNKLTGEYFASNAGSRLSSQNKRTHKPI